MELWDPFDSLVDWERRENPSDAQWLLVREFIATVGSLDPTRHFVAIPGSPGRYEVKVPGTSIFLDLFHFAEVDQISVERIERGTGF